MKPAIPENTALPPEPPDAEGFCQRGMARFDEGRFDEALAEW